MEKKNIETIITVIALVVFVILLINTFSKSKKTPKPKETGKSAQEIIEPKKEGPKGHGEVQWGRDPFVLGSQKTAEGGAFNLSAIIWDEKKPLAVVNGEVVSEGEEIEGCCVLKINQESVVIKKGEEEQVIELYK